jgi:hypothetical protein
MAEASSATSIELTDRGFQASLPSREFWEDPKAGTGARPAQWGASSDRAQGDVSTQLVPDELNVFSFIPRRYSGRVTRRISTGEMLIPLAVNSSSGGRGGQPSSAIRPALVIRIRTASITARAGPITTSRSAVARPSWTRPAIVARSNPWARTSRSSVMPCGKLASSASAWRCSLTRLGFHGGTAIRAELTE